MGTVDDGFHIVVVHHLADGFHICDIKVSGLLTFHLIDIRKNIMVSRVLANDTHLVAKLTIGTCY